METETTRIILLTTAVLILHAIDMTTTVIIIKRLERKFKNAYEVEQNFHKYFMKRLGIIKGAITSSLISFPILATITVISIRHGSYQVILGMTITIAIMNTMMVLKKEELKKKLIPRKEYAKEEIKRLKEFT